MRTASALSFVLLLSMLLSSPAGADTYYTDTLYARVDTANESWAMSGVGGEHYERFDEEDSPNDADYIYENTINDKQNFLFFDPDSSAEGEVLDTLIFQIRAQYSGGSGGTSVIEYGMWYYDAGWQQCTYDTTDELTTDWEYFADTLALNPCTEGSWLWGHLYPSLTHYAWGFLARRVRTGIPTPESNRMSWAILIIKSHTVAAEGEDNPRRNRIIRKMLRGEVDEKRGIFTRLSSADWRE